ncbi:MAG: DUF3106 domain-containing protein [Haliea sp.]|nr:DUF3106 domain-containing protein [Haliea sp.]
MSITTTPYCPCCDALNAPVVNAIETTLTMRKRVLCRAQFFPRPTSPMHSNGTSGPARNRTPYPAVVAGETLPAERRARLVQRAERIKHLTPEQQAQVRERAAVEEPACPMKNAGRIKARLQQWQSLPDEQREQLKQRYRELTPEQKTQLQARREEMRSLPPEEREAIRKRFKAARGLPPEQREAIRACAEGKSIQEGQRIACAVAPGCRLLHQSVSYPTIKPAPP